MRYYDAFLNALGIEVVTQDEYQPADVLAKLLVVDGSDSGLDADLLDGQQATAFAVAGHDHAGVYQPADADLAAIAALSGTGGYAKRTAADTWAITTPSAADVGADASGTAAGAVSTHEGATDPHSQYETQGRADARYSQLGHAHAGVYESVLDGAGVLSKLAPVDGAGSGLDADKLDGLHFNDFSHLVNTDVIFENGNYFYSTFPSCGTATSNLSAGNLYAYPITIPFQMDVDLFTLKVTTLVAGKNCRFAIYNSYPLDYGYAIANYLRNLIYDSGNISVATTGVKSISITPISFSPGIYWVVFAQEDAVAKFIANNARFFGSSVSFVPISCIYFTFSYASAFPSNFNLYSPTVANSLVPSVTFRWS